MQFKNIEINNFRGFDHLKIEDFGQINLFVGKNNAGKSSVLESIFLLAGCTNAELGYRINLFRDAIVIDNNHSPEQGFKAIFHNLDENQYVIIKTVITEKTNYNSKSTGNLSRKVVERRLEIKPHYKTHFDNQELLTNNSGKRVVDGLIFSSKLDNGKNYESKFVVESNGGEIQAESKYILPVHFNHSRSSENSSRLAIEELFKKRKEQKVVEFLSKIDDRIRGFQFIGNKLYFDLEGIEERVPISVVGDGIRKTLTILSSIWGGEKDTIILIDEIETGLHYTAHKTLWKGIIEACRMSNAQIFATTHSAESIKYLAEILAEEGYQDFQEKVRCYRLSNSPKGFRASKFTYETLQAIVEDEYEIRM